MHSPNIIVIIPTYNERRNIVTLVNNLFCVNLPLSVLVIDDNSPDKTSEEVIKLQRIYNNLHLIIRDKKRGLGSAYIEGFNQALRNGYEVIIQMDADLSHSPSCIPGMVALLNKYDMVIGSRYVKGADVRNWSSIRIILSKLANAYARILLRVPIKDLTSGFKCTKRAALSEINFSTVVSRGYAFQIEMVSRVLFKGFRVIECPIAFVGRGKDKSKMSLGIALETFIRVISLSF